MESLARTQAACSRFAHLLPAIGLLASGLALLGAPLAASPVSVGPPLFFSPGAQPQTFHIQAAHWQALVMPGQVEYKLRGRSIVARFVGANPDAALQPGPAEGTVNDLRSSIIGNARPSVPLTASLTCKNLYPGIDLVYRSAGTHLKSEYLVSPGADAGQIRLRYQSPARPVLDPGGSLVITTASATLREEPPLVYQETPHGPEHVSARYVLRDRQTVAFALGPYDHTRPLIIDPTVTISTLWGGTLFDGLTGIATGLDGSLYVCGWTESSDVPVTGPYQRTLRSAPDAFVMKLSPSGDAIRYATYLGGTGQDRCNAIAVDAAGFAYVTGTTSSTDFPVLNAAQATNRGNQDAFVTKLSVDGASLVYSTYLGGENVDGANAIAVDASGSAYVAGQTWSTSFPVLSAAQAQNKGRQDAFVTKLAPAGNAWVYSTDLGGANDDQAYGIALQRGEAYVAGATASTNFPVFNALQPSLRGSQDAFVAKVGASGNSLGYSTYLGGSGGSAGAPEMASAVVVTALGEAYVAGTTGSADFPILQPYQATLAGGTDAFLCKLNATGTALLSSTFLGGSGNDQANALAIDTSGGLHLTGTTYSQDFPTRLAVQTGSGGLQDMFLTSFLPGITDIRSSTYWGGSGAEEGLGIAIDSTGSPIVVGRTLSNNFPLVLPRQIVNGGGYGGFLVRVSSAILRVSSAGIVRDGLWLTDNNADGGFTNEPNDKLMWLGQAGDTPIVADWNGDGRSKAGTFRAGLWVLDGNGNEAWDGWPLDIIGFLGQAGDIPVAGDWTGDGHAKIGVFRAGTWLIDYNGNGRWDGTTGGDQIWSLGKAGDTPVVGDWNGDGRSKMAIFREGMWLLDWNGNGQWDGPGIDRILGMGGPGDIAVLGDWNGDGRIKVGAFHEGLWLLDYNGNGVWDGTIVANPDKACYLGQRGDIPVVGDWNGDGRVKMGIFREGFWILDFNGNCQWDGTSIDRLASLGTKGDIPVVGKW